MAKKENPVLRTPGAVDDTININNNTTTGAKNQVVSDDCLMAEGGGHD